MKLLLLEQQYEKQLSFTFMFSSNAKLLVPFLVQAIPQIETNILTAVKTNSMLTDALKK